MSKFHGLGARSLEPNLIMVDFRVYNIKKIVCVLVTVHLRDENLYVCDYVYYYVYLRYNQV